MKKKFVLTMFFVTFFSTLFIGNVFATCKFISPETIPFIYVEDVGRFDLTNNKIDLVKVIKDRETIMGKKIDIPKEMTIFVPSTSKTAANILKINSGQLDKENVFILKGSSSKETALRVFYGPSILDEYGQTVPNATVWFEGLTSFGHLSDGNMINPAARMSKGDKEIRMIIYKPGYALKIVPIVLNDEVLKDNVKQAVCLDDIVLSKEPNRVVRVTFANQSEDIYKSAKAESFYVKTEDGYGFVYTIHDQHQKKTFSASCNLADHTFPVLDLKEGEASQEYTKVKRKDIPITIQRILPEINISYSEIRKKPELKVSTITKSKMDGKLKFFLILFALGLIVVCGVYVRRSVSSLKNEMEVKAKRKKEDELAYRLRLVHLSPSYHTIKKAESLCKDRRLNSGSRDILLETIKKLMEILDGVKRIDKDLVKLENKAQALKEFQRGRAIKMRSNIEGKNYDLAMAIQTQIEESERQSTMVVQSLKDIKGIIATRKKAAREIMNILKEAVLRADAMIDQVDGAINLNDLGEGVNKVMTDLVKSFGEESSIDIDPKAIKDSQAVRRDSQLSGISAADIEKLENFVSKRQ